MRRCIFLSILFVQTISCRLVIGMEDGTLAAEDSEKLVSSDALGSDAIESSVDGGFADADVSDTDTKPVITPGMIVSTPGSIACRDVNCDAPKNMCCIAGDAGTCSTTCSVGGYVFCDEAADCSPGYSCCDACEGRTVCRQPSWGCGLMNQYCRTNAECPSGKCGHVANGQGVCVVP